MFIKFSVRRPVVWIFCFVADKGKLRSQAAGASTENLRADWKKRNPSQG